MTLEEIDKKMAELKEQKKEKLRQEKAKELRKKNQEKAKKRRLESRVKFIIGGYYLKQKPDCIKEVMQSGKLRPQDVETINTYLSL
ncbi:MAG: hypothetical protein MJ196_12450 [Treponemataceae bacterium]|nr:hypothetical protein [Treponemataceae bacterium]